jgi:hypothetical protein
MYTTALFCALGQEATGEGRFRPSAYSPFQALDYRARRVTYLLREDRRPRKWDDAWTRLALRYARLVNRRQRGSCRRALPPAMRDVEDACQLYQTGGLPRWHLEARLLTGEPQEQTAQRCGLSVTAVAAYEALFFAVAGNLDARDYLIHRCIGRKAHDGLDEHDVDLLLKIYALTGGPLVVDALADYFRDPPVVPERPELLAAEELEALRGKLLVRAAILARTLPGDDPKSLRKLAVLQQAMAILRDDGDQRGEALAGPLRPAIDLPRTAPAATGVVGDPPALGVNAQVA